MEPVAPRKAASRPSLMTTMRKTSRALHEARARRTRAPPPSRLLEAARENANKAPSCSAVCRKRPRTRLPQPGGRRPPQRRPNFRSSRRRLPWCRRKYLFLCFSSLQILSEFLRFTFLDLGPRSLLRSRPPPPSLGRRRPPPPPGESTLQPTSGRRRNETRERCMRSGKPLAGSRQRRTRRRPPP